VNSAEIDRKRHIARVLLDVGAVGFSPHAPITFKSGLKSPVYVDNRRLPYWPEHWRAVIEAFQALITDAGLRYDVIAGIEAAGIPHSAALAYSLVKPSVFVRKQEKAHGTRSRIEGGNVSDKRVLLIEDLVTTGGSSLAGVEALREAGAVVDDCLAIISYGFDEAREGFAAAGVRLHTLTAFDAVLQEAETLRMFSASDFALIREWLDAPHEWAERHGFV
jgi:orotate phosphoribosyltransferase